MNHNSRIHLTHPRKDSGYLKIFQFFKDIHPNPKWLNLSSKVASDLSKELESEKSDDKTFSYHIYHIINKKLTFRPILKNEFIILRN